MKSSITFFITVLLAPVISLQAQTYFVRTVSGHGFIPETSIEVTDNEGRSISCKARDLNYKKLSKQHCETDSLIKSLETCTNCKIVKTKEQLNTLNKALKLGSPECASGYGVPVYAMYTKKADGSLRLINKVAKGCGITANGNKLIDELIADFEKPADKNVLTELNKVVAVKESKPITGVLDTDFTQVTGTFGYTARLTTEGYLHCKTKAKPVSAEIIFQKPVPGIYKPNYNFEGAIREERKTYAVKEKTGGAYLIDISSEKYKENHSITLIFISAKGEKASVKLVNQKVREIDLRVDKSQFHRYMPEIGSWKTSRKNRDWEYAPQHYFVRMLPSNASQPGMQKMHIFIVNNKGKSLKGAGIGTFVKIAGNPGNLLPVMDSLINQLDICKDCPSVRTSPEMDSISKAEQVFINAHITYHLPVQGRPVYSLYAKDEYGQLRHYESISRGGSIYESENKIIDDFVDVIERYEKNNAAIANALQAGALVIKSADKDFDPRITYAQGNTLACTIWIDNAGLVHCKTANPLKSSDIFFHSPRFTGIENGNTNTTLPKEYTKNYIPKKISAQEYTMDISAEKIRQMDKITVIVEDTDGKNAMVNLINNRPGIPR
ncbi:MAG: hypothetical protein WKF85_15575 [Chitinophagaceae bacterium]